MTKFPLRIVTPDGVIFEERVEMVTVDAVGGQLGILAGHTPCLAVLKKDHPLVIHGPNRRGSCAGGILRVTANAVALITASFAWDEDG